MSGALCTIYQLIYWVVNVYTIVLLIYAVISWIPELRVSALERVLSAFVEPLLLPIRRIVPPVGGIDIAFLILILLLQFLVRPPLGNLEAGACALVY
ncbi:MAG: YggT family protein [Candidatus Tyrphobacter sp.]